MNATTYIYAHLEPTEDEIRYIGKSDDPPKRLRDHLGRAAGERHHHANWLNLLVARGLIPRLEIIVEVPTEEWEFWETHYIKYFRDCGFDLTNATPGGDGLGSGKEHPRFGKKHSVDTRARMRLAALGEKNHNFGITLSAETCAKMSASRTGSKNPRFGNHSPRGPYRKKNELQSL